MLRSVITILLICATSLVQAAEIEATLEWANRRVAAFAVTGVVDKVLIAAGESVKKGQLLAQLDQSPFAEGFGAEPGRSRAVASLGGY